MSWFEDQIKQRKENDDQVFSESFSKLASAVTGETGLKNDLDISYDAICSILKYYGYTNKKEVPAEITDFNDQLEFLCRPVGLMRRAIKLTEGWYKDCIGAVIAFRKDDGTAVAMIPSGSGYKFLQDGKYVTVDSKNEKQFGFDGICFYKPFPLRKITQKDLVEYAFKTRSVKDFAIIISFMVLATVMGLVMPKISYFLYSYVVEEGSVGLLISTLVFMLCTQISMLLFRLFQSLYNGIVGTKMSIAVSAATMMRILSLPANFFRDYSSGELSTRSGNLSSLCESLMSIIFDTGFSSLFSLVYIFSIFEYAPGLVVPAICVIVVTVAFSCLSTFTQMKISKEKMEVNAKISGNSYSMVTGIQKIRLSGSEKRAFARWAKLYSQGAALNYNPPFFLKINSVISLCISLAGTLVMYFFAIKTQVSLAEYTAFTSAYGMVFGAFSSLASIATSLANIKPVLDMAQPIMDAEPEIAENKEIVSKINGTIEMSNISFRYSESMPLIVDNMSLKIKSGEYIAIVGKTGCGKSTLIRLLLGFEKPQKGSIYYDGKDMNSLDLRSLRRKIGVVLQDGKLFQGDIFSNITISAPWLTLDDAWAAAEVAGIADDIRRMPMGMNTYITEGGGGISGGQRQRLLIARAIAPNPKVLIFDEATSALDNITQKKVSESLDKLKCTRIVIAHRLSTIQHCDRILYFEEGKIKEEGSFDELIAKDGLFAELVKRQRLDIDQ